MKENIRWSFANASHHVDRACAYLDILIRGYELSDLDLVEKAGRISAIRAKQDYLKGIKFDPDAHPWSLDKEN